MSHNAAFRSVVEAVFKECPESFEEVAKASTRTRPPAYFDAHLHDDLVLRQIRCFPNLDTVLTQVAHNALDDLVSNTPEVISTSDLAWDPYPRETLHDEATIAEYYSKHTAARAKVLANLLINNGTSPLKWQASPISRALGAIPDGFLRFRNPGHAPKVPSSVQLPGRSEKEAYKLAIASWEFKTPSAAPNAVQDAIEKMMGKPYSWYRCHGPLDKACSCKAGHSVAGVVHYTSQVRSPDGDLEDFKYIQTFPTSPPSGPPTYYRARESIAAEGGRPEAKARHIIQQAWAQAVKEDVTFLVINMGQREFIGYRHRGSQTLFLSRPYRVYDENYTGIHIGLWLAAYRDVMERVRLLNSAFTVMDAGPSTSKLDPDPVAVKVLSNYKEKPKQTTQNLLKIMSIEQLLCNIPSINVKITHESTQMESKLPWRRYDVAGYPLFDDVRALEQKVSQHHRLKTLPDSWPIENWHLVMTPLPATEDPLGAFSHGAVLKEKYKRTTKEVPGGLVARVTLGPPQTISDLRDQYINYWKLRDAGASGDALVPYYTLFVAPDDIAAVLIAARPGVSLWHLDDPLDVHTLFKNQLNHFHQSGYLHGKFHKEDLYVQSSSVAVFDGFGSIKPHEDEEDKGPTEEEAAQLSVLLDEYVAKRDRQVAEPIATTSSAQSGGLTPVPEIKVEEEEIAEEAVQMNVEEESLIEALEEGEIDEEMALAPAGYHQEGPGRRHKRTYSSISLNPQPLDADRKGKRRAT
ncbi:hypothetical protein BDN72DRAFT_960740 [Pluteus cervinus]|uniref:Uncharacterized protein n=1 Tax=Pluteus cervinus TaxID=181527 RepID=A0ACD3AQH1_9AGAR|nr:hypothetical protein BDN72DRAFT_960740 [Pluteus cervinus]